MKTLHGLLMAGVALNLSAGFSAAQGRKDYRQVHITHGTSFEFFPKMNNRGQVVFTRRVEENDSNSEEIFLWDNGVLTQLTFDHRRDAYPDINDEGTIVWSRGIGPRGPWGRTLEIMMRTPDGVVTQITDDGLDDYQPEINNLGHIVWNTETEFGCEGRVLQMDVRYYDGESVQWVTQEGYSGGGITNQAASINDSDDIVWTRYDFCVDGWWTSDVMMRQNQVTKQISPEDVWEPQVARINNDGLVVWMYVKNHQSNALQIWQDGATVDLTDWGATPRINNHGDIAFHRWYDAESNYQIWLYRNGQFRQLTFDNGYNYVPEINDFGDIVFQCGRPFTTDVCLLDNLLEPHGDPTEVRPR